MVTKRALKAPIRKPRLRKLQGAMYPHFNGGYGTIPAWTPASARATEAVRFIRQFDDGIARNLTGSSDTDADGIRISTAYGPTIAYLDATDTLRFAAGPVGSIKLGVEHEIRGEFYPDRVECWLDGELVGTQPIAPKQAWLREYIGATAPATENFIGPILSYQLTDHTPLQGVRAMGGNSGQWASIPEITLDGDFEFSFWWKRQDRTGTNFGSVAGRSADIDDFIRLNDSGNATPDNVIVRVNTTQVAGAAALASVAQGQHTFIRIARVSDTVTVYVDGVEFPAGSAPGTVNIDQLWANVDVNGVPTPMASIHIHDLETGQVYKYNNANDSGNLLRNSSDRDVLGAELATVGRVTEWTGQENNYATKPLAEAVPLKVGAVYRYVIDLTDGVSGQLKIDVEGGPFPNGDSPAVSAGESLTVDLKANGTFCNIQTVEGDNRYVGVARISCRRIHALGTAEGEELDLPPVSAWDMTDGASVQPDGSVRITTTFNDFQQIVSQSLTVGQAYRVEVKADVISGQMNLNLGPNTETDFAPIGGGWYRAYGLAGAIGLAVKRDGGGGEDDFIVHDVRAWPVTHGVWYESGAALKSAAANAARTFLPWVNRYYDLSQMPQTKPAASQLQGGYFMVPSQTADRFAAMPDISLAGDFDIYLPMIRRDSNPGTSATRQLGHKTISTDFISIKDTGHAVPNQIGFSCGAEGFQTVGYMDALVGEHTSLSFHRRSGQLTCRENGVAKLTVASTATFNINQFGTGNDLGVANCEMAAIIHDLETGQVWKYNNKNDPGTVLRNSSDRDVLGLEGLTSPLDFSADAPFYGGAFSRTETPGVWGTTGAGSGPRVEGATPTAGVYRVEWSGLDANSEVWRVIDGGFENLSSAASGSMVFKVTEVEAGPTTQSIYLRSTAGGQHSISSLSIRRIHALGTAEGEELWDDNPPFKNAEWQKRSTSTYYLDGSQSASRVINLLTNATPNAQYKIRFKLNITAGGARARAGGIDGSSYFASGEYEQVIPAGTSADVSIVGYSDMVGSVTILSVVEQRHGIWQNATAADRVYLPTLPREFVDGGAVTVPDRMGSGDAVTFTGISADDIAPPGK